MSLEFPANRSSTEYLKIKLMIEVLIKDTISLLVPIRIPSAIYLHITRAPKYNTSRIKDVIV